MKVKGHVFGGGVSILLVSTIFFLILELFRQCDIFSLSLIC
jgi:hypothetical protein